MPTYVYETTGAKKRQFEVRQSMNDAALTKDPETGEPVRRVISGGYGIMEKASAKKRTAQPTGGHSCCGGACGCH
jgi:predicted nucleic acid-binding Zn ribbon protein